MVPPRDLFEKSECNHKQSRYSMVIYYFFCVSAPWGAAILESLGQIIKKNNKKGCRQKNCRQPKKKKLIL
jgi:hypothetical protein